MMLYNDLAPGIYILHENKEWIPPFGEAFKRAGVGFGEMFLTKGAIDLDSPPPSGVFWSRLSASSHTRGNALSKEYGRAILAWLEAHGRKVINGSSVLEFEVSKIRQYLALNAAGIRTPRTIGVFGREDLKKSARQLKAPFITKHNQGGKGIGVRRFESYAELDDYVDSPSFEPPIDGIFLLQEYVKSREFFITRCEFIGARFHYAVRVDTSNGAFELCPAESCEIEAQKSQKNALPSLAGAACEVGAAEKFTLRKDINAATPLVKKLETFLQKHRIDIAGVEFIEAENGESVVYDINTNTNYNKALEARIRDNGGVCAADRVVRFLQDSLQDLKN